MNIFVGNLPFGMTDDELHELFAKFGEITRATVIKDRVTGKSRGFDSSKWRTTRWPAPQSRASTGLTCKGAP